MIQSTFCSPPKKIFSISGSHFNQTSAPSSSATSPFRMKSPPHTWWKACRLCSMHAWGSAAWPEGRREGSRWPRSSPRRDAGTTRTRGRDGTCLLRALFVSGRWGRKTPEEIKFWSSYKTFSLFFPARLSLWYKSEIYKRSFTLEGLHGAEVKLWQWDKNKY